MVATQKPLPARLARLAAAWSEAGEPAQPGIPWPRGSWANAFADRSALIERLPARLSRDAVRNECRTAAASPHAAVDAFLVTMMWGYGNVGYGRYRTSKVLVENPNAARTLQQAAQRQAESGPLEAYRFLANEGRLRHLGPAFGTKYLHFVSPGTRSEALVLDALVSRAIRKLTGISLRPWQWRTPTYERYLSLIGGWAAEIGIDPSDVEMLLFVSEARGQWAVGWLPPDLRFGS